MLGLPRPGTGPMSPALAGGLNHWTTREVPVVNFWSWVISILRFIYYSLYYVWPWDSLVAQRVKCLPAMWETWVRSLGRNPGEENGNLLQYSCLENPMDRGAWWATVHSVTKSQTQLSDFTFLPMCWYIKSQQYFRILTKYKNALKALCIKHKQL